MMVNGLRTLMAALLIGLMPVAYAGWNPLEDDGKSESAVSDLEVAATISNFKRQDPDLKVFFDKAWGYAVFPTVGKGGIGIGGAWGRGRVYEQGHYTGDTTLTQLTVGFQLGAQAYSEIIFFRDKQALARFIEGNFELGAQASAVAATAGASADADYSDGVAIFTMARGGLMYEASVGGQKFSYQARNRAPDS